MKWVGIVWDVLGFDRSLSHGFTCYLVISFSEMMPYSFGLTKFIIALKDSV